MRLIDADALKKAIIKYLCVKSENNLLPAEKSIYNLIDKQPTVEPLKEQKEQGNKLDYLFSKIAGHSDYHGDSILTAITCVKEGKEIGSIMPKDGDEIHGMNDERG